MIVPCGPRVGSQTGASHQEAEVINDNRVTLVTIVWINITTIQTIVWNSPAPPVVLPVPTRPRPTKIVTPHGVALPDVTGEGQSKAQSDLSSLGFTNVALNNVVGSPGDTTGSVTSESPGAGAMLLANQRITLTVVVGIQVPDETGAPANTALSDLSSLGFTNVVVNGDPTGTVSSQSPAGGSMLLANGRITLNTTALGNSPSTPPSQPAQPPANPTPPPATPAQPPAPQQIAVPNEVGNDVNSAQSDLSSAGFTNVIVNTVPGPAGTASGTVLSQTPAAGAMALPGDTITLTVAQ